MSASLRSALAWWASTAGERVALVVGDDELCYRDLYNWTGSAARFLNQHGVRPGDRVGILGGNSLMWCVSALGAVKAGAVVVPLNPRLMPAELQKTIQDGGISTVLADTAFAETMVDLAAAGCEPNTVGFEQLERLRDGGADDFGIDLVPDDPAMVLFTSGTTGLSKGVVCTNNTLLNIAFEASLTQEGLHAGTRTLLTLPLAFTPGLVWGLAMNVVLGGRLVVEPDFAPGRAVRLIEKHRIEAMFGVPLIFEQMASAEEFAGADLTSLKTALTGGAPVSVELLEQWGAKGVALRQIYGLTEAGGVATATSVDEASTYPDMCGTGSIFTEFKVVRNDGTGCEPGEAGEIILHGPGVTPGYWNAPESTANALRDGWLHTGDLGMTDADGRLKFVDRLKDLIISGGINVSPVEIEQVLTTVEGVHEVAVVSAAHQKFGETPAAVVVMDGTQDTERLLNECSANLADYKVPRYIVFRDDPLPRMSNGKLDKVAIRKEYGDIAKIYSRVR